MSNAKFAAAKELIQEKRYAAARAVLETMPDNAQAQQWLAKLARLDPPPKPKRRRLSGCMAVVLIVVLAALVLGGLFVLNLRRTLEVTTSCARIYIYDDAAREQCIEAGGHLVGATLIPGAQLNPSTATVTEAHSSLEPTAQPALLAVPPREGQYYLWVLGAQSVNAYAAPSVEAEVVTRLEPDITYRANGEVQGDVVDGNSVWVELDNDGLPVYVSVTRMTGNRLLTGETNLPLPTSTFGPGTMPPPTPTRRPSMTPRPPSNSSSASSCPSSCAEARARGISAGRAAACGLDSDGDGQACYGD